MVLFCMSLVCGKGFLLWDFISKFAGCKQCCSCWHRSFLFYMLQLLALIFFVSTGGRSQQGEGADVKRCSQWEQATADHLLWLAWSGWLAEVQPAQSKPFSVIYTSFEFWSILSFFWFFFSLNETTLSCFNYSAMCSFMRDYMIILSSVGKYSM